MDRCCRQTRQKALTSGTEWRISANCTTRRLTSLPLSTPTCSCAVTVQAGSTTSSRTMATPSRWLSSCLTSVSQPHCCPLVRATASQSSEWRTPHWCPPSCACPAAATLPLALSSASARSIILDEWAPLPMQMTRWTPCTPSGRPSAARLGRSTVSRSPRPKSPTSSPFGH